jgi:two-component system chemotaxis sensor kinase CheA
MDDFIEQFLVEARELVVQATEDLLALEQDPGQAERLDSAFRAFHTLKGAAGIVDFDAMGRVLHAGEDLLAAVRAGGETLTPAAIGRLLACLDQVVQWLDAMQASGDVPEGADAAADAVLARFEAGRREQGVPDTGAAGDDWAARLVAEHVGTAGAAATALRYTPEPDSFFRGEDPLARIEALPGVAAVSLGPRSPWAALETFDPFTCQIVITALSTAPVAEVRAALHDLGAQVDLEELRPAVVQGPGRGDLSAEAVAVLREQMAMLGQSHAEDIGGRIGSAAAVSINVLRHAGLGEARARLEAALERSREEADPGMLVAAIRAELDGPLGTAPEPPGQSASVPQDLQAQTLRVDVEKIDAVVRLAGELIVLKNALGHTTGLALEGTAPADVAARLKEQHALLERLAGELQRSMLAIRVLPMRHVFQRFPRLVRDMSVKLDKPINLVVEGDATEADKAVVESLFEPLLHVLRNALDHGVEPAALRAERRKPAVATIRLDAARQGETVVIRVEDDGGGVDVARVRQVAEARGVATAEALAAMSDEEAVDLIFAPGFSTAETVTSLSGRGVGMDAVRSAVERLGGRVRIGSRVGQGTIVRFVLPFTVMITRVMTVEAGGQVFGIPFEAVRETVRIPRERIIAIGAAKAFVLRNRTIPVVDLARTLDLPASRDEPADAILVVASLGDGVGAVEVEHLGERMDVMLKPVEGLLAGMPGIGGTTLLGDGRVMLVLDLEELLR